MTDTTQEELPPLPDECYKYERLVNAMHEWGHQCIATLRAENERLHKLLDDAEAVLVRQRDARTAAQSQAAAMAGLLAKARAKMRGAVEPDDVALNDEIDAAIRALDPAKEGTK